MSFGWKLSQWKYATTLNRIDIIHSRSKNDLMDLKRIYKIKSPFGSDSSGSVFI